MNAALGTAGVVPRPRRLARSASSPSPSASSATGPTLLRLGARLRRASSWPARVLAFVGDGAGADHPRLLARSYVADNGSRRRTPPLFNFATLWSALEGSILLWALILAGYTAAVDAQVPQAARPTRSSAGRSLTMFVVAAFFFLLMLGPANPFKHGRRRRPDSTAPAPTRCCRTTS